MFIQIDSCSRVSPRLKLLSIWSFPERSASLPCSPDSLADSPEADRHNGGHDHAASEEKEAKRTRPQEDSSTAGPSRGRQEAGERSQHKVQVRVALSGKCVTHSLVFILLKFMHKHIVMSVALKRG